MFGLIYVATIIIGGTFFARINLRHGRGDRRSAMRLAFFTIGLFLLKIILSVPHVSNIDLLLLPYLAVLFWILYIAIEPYVRRRWPQVLVSWTRLLSGGFRDPLVAREIFIGCAFGVSLACIIGLIGVLSPEWSFYALRQTLDLTAILGPRTYVIQLADIVTTVLVLNFGLLSLLFFIRTLLRNQTAALIVTAIIIVFASGGSLDIWILLRLLIGATIYLIVLMRFGFVAQLFSYFSFTMLKGITTLDASTWYSDAGFFSLAIFAVIVLYTFHTSLGGRPLFGTPRLDE